MLVYDRKSLNQEETSKSKPDNKEVVFTAKYFCNNCKEPVIVTGIGYTDDLQVGKYYPDLLLYSPLFFTPTIHLFRIHPRCPEEVRKQIIKSFSLFWSDPYSCVNKLRLSLELLMDHAGIAHAWSPMNATDKIRKYKLHQRIDMFKKENQDIGNKLNAIKKIGNKGSHADDILSVNEAIDAYELLEESLNEIYSQE